MKPYDIEEKFRRILKKSMYLGFNINGDYGSRETDTNEATYTA